MDLLYQQHYSKEGKKIMHLPPDPRTHLLHLLAEVDTAHRTIAHKQYLGFSMVENIPPTTDSTAGDCK